MRYRLASLLILLLAPIVSAQRGGPAAQLPPLVYVCPMPGDEAVLEDKPGSCPICKMTLVPIRLDSKWWCPTHQTLVVRDGPGKCPMDGKDLVQVTLSEHWTCADQPGTKLLEPGNCPDGKPRKIVYEVRAHGDHNPRHGGDFFMASDAWHHLEGTYPSAGLFRVFFYDNFTKPVAAKAFSGTFVVLDQANKEVGAFPLAAGRDATTLEARIPAALAALPLKGAAKIRFGPKVAEQRFDFGFTAYSKEPAPAVTAAPQPAAPAPVAAAPTPAPVAAPPPPPVQEPTPAQAPKILDQPLQLPPMLAEVLDESKLPTTTAGLFAALATRSKEVETLVTEGSLSQVWVPATAAKTIALVLNDRASDLPERQRSAVSVAAKRIVTAVWEIDTSADLGNRARLTVAYERLSSAVDALKAAYAQ